ncbi:hypothetical protein LJC33_05175 [Eubacteriales bacterium OttesenSCG-928-N13]|nr:hypothetical protein [Eubacteriales bacterium OttesenSCG-928-N13]
MKKTKKLIALLLIIQLLFAQVGFALVQDSSDEPQKNESSESAEKKEKKKEEKEEKKEEKKEEPEKAPEKEPEKPSSDESKKSEDKSEDDGQVVIEEQLLPIEAPSILSEDREKESIKVSVTVASEPIGFGHIRETGEIVEPLEPEELLELQGVDILLSIRHEGDVLMEGTPVTITAEITGIPEDVKYRLQWQNDISGSYADVSGETGSSVTFAANNENVTCNWRVVIWASKA